LSALTHEDRPEARFVQEFLWKNAVPTLLAELTNFVIPSALFLARGICCSAGKKKQIPRSARNDKSGGFVLTTDNWVPATEYR
jgi:hypothetical protein